MNEQELQGGQRANLYGANLYGANLYGANLRGADLYGADLRGADLRGADLRGADLRGADLRGANLRGANLYGMNLYGADLYGADLRWANLRGANLRGANLRGADLYEADLRGANLYGANLEDATLPHFQLPPEEGTFTAWKKVQGGVVLKLLVTEDAKRTSSLIGRKCRASHVIPVEAFTVMDGKLVPATGKRFEGRHQGGFWYTLGRKRKADKYDPDIRMECTHGIHFFMTKQEAIEW